MAHVAKLGALTNELVTLLTSTSAESNPAKFSIHRESALRSLRYHNYPRTNQFDVASQLEGLEEKFRVYNEDPLADALRERVDILSKTEAKWTPEILHLLLELSNKPVFKSKLDDLDFLKGPDPDTGPPLQWEDIIAEDPLLRDKSVWRNVDFGAGSSDGEDGFDDSRSALSAMTETTVLSSIDDFYGPECHIVDHVDKDALENLRLAQFWKATPSVGGVKLETVKKPITELQAIREVLFMLGGFPTSLFETQPEIPTILTPSKSYAMKHASADTFYQLAKTFADQGSAVMVLRSWAMRPQSVPLLQVFQSSIVDRVRDFEAHLSMIQQRFVAIEEDVVVSLISVQAEIRPYLRRLLRLSDITQRLDGEPYAHAFRYLEILYDETCTSQMAGDDDMYAFLGRIFFDCFQVYLRPIRTWMEDGELKTGDMVFFISETAGEVEPASLWQARFKVRKTQAGILHAPRFLRAAANKIFTTGKSVVVLKQLNQIASLQCSRDMGEPVVDFESVCGHSTLRLAPFPELFETAFDAWVQSKHHYASSRLRKTLFDSCGLHTSLDGLSYLYFMADGSTAAAFTNSIFDKLDTLDALWSDRFTLTELAQSTFGSLPPISSERLRAHIIPLPRKLQDVARCRRSVKTLSAVELQYHLSWPIQIILTPTTIASYRRVFSFLLQVRRSSHILSRRRLIADGLTNSSNTDECTLYYSLRTRLLWFTDTIYYYLTSLVIEPNSQRMREELKEAEDVDAMIEAHATYIKEIIDQALLGSRLDLIHQTVLKILDMSIKLEDAKAANAVANKESMDRQQELMDLSVASLGLHTPDKRLKNPSKSARKVQDESSSDDDDEKEIDVDLSILSSTSGNRADGTYAENLSQMKTEFDRLVRFVANGLKGVARAGSGEGARSWDILAEMIDSGLGRVGGSGSGSGSGSGGTLY